MSELESEKQNKNGQRQRFDPELLKKGLRCDLDQYEMLKRCSDKKDITEWNQWRKRNPNEEILLEGIQIIKANLDDIDLSNAYLREVKLRGAYLKHVDLENAYLDRADLILAHLECADLAEAHLERANLSDAHMEFSCFIDSHLEGINLRNANLSDANLMGASLKKATCHFTNFDRANLLRTDMSGARLFAAHLNDAKLGQDMEVFELTSDKALKNKYILARNIKGLEFGADLRGAILWYVDLRGAKLSRALLQRADFRWAIVDGETTIRKCQVDRRTDFREVGLENARIDPATKHLLKYNGRRMNWEDWYKEHPKLKWLVKPFWWASDYGLSTWRIIGCFSWLSLLFAAIYSNLAYWFPPGIISNLGIEPHLPLWHYFLLLLLRPIYFSVVTMTTLGFGDMYANAHSIWGHILLSLQVILGYVLLGALVTRFAVLFTAGGPAGKFADDKEEKTKPAESEQGT